MTIRETIIKIRAENNLSQQEFAEKIAVSRTTLARWETGKSTPSLIQIKKICSTFSLDANTFLSPEHLSFTAEKKIENEVPIKNNPNSKTVKKAALVSLAIIAFVGLIVTIIYAIKDAMYDSSVTVWIMSIPQNTPMLVLSLFLIVFIGLLIKLIYSYRGKHK